MPFQAAREAAKALIDSLGPGDEVIELSLPHTANGHASQPEEFNAADLLGLTREVTTLGNEVWPFRLVTKLKLMLYVEYS